jgi:hypothetical protein
VKRYEFHCHSSVLALLKAELDAGREHSYAYFPAFTSMDIFTHEEMRPGWYEIWCDGEVVQHGYLILPAGRYACRGCRFSTDSPQAMEEHAMDKHGQVVTVEDSSPDTPGSSPQS